MQDLPVWNRHKPCYLYNMLSRLYDWDQAHFKKCRYVILQEKAVVGWAVLSPVSLKGAYSGVAEISIYIDEKHKGMGVGTKLMNHMIQESEKNGFWLLESLIFQNNPASLRLHEKCGFREVGYREKMGKDKYGTWRNVVLMEKRSSLNEFN